MECEHISFLFCSGLVPSKDAYLPCLFCFSSEMGRTTRHTPGAKRAERDQASVLAAYSESLASPAGGRGYRENPYLGRDPAPAGVAKKGRTRTQARPPRFSTPPRENAERCWPWKHEQKLSGGAFASSAAVAPARTARASLLEEEEKDRENRVTRWRKCSAYRGGGGRASELWGAKGGEGGCVCGCSERSRGSGREVPVALVAPFRG